MGEGGGALDLGHQTRPVPDQGAGLQHVGGLLHEGQGHPVDPEVEAKGQVGAVLGGQGRQVEDGAGDIHPLAVGQKARGLHQGVDPVGLHAGDPHPDAAVVDQQPVAGQDGGKDLRMGQGDAHHVPVRAAGQEADGLPRRQGDLPVLQGAHPDLGALQVHQYADGAVHLLLQGAQGGVGPGVILVRAMAEIEPEGVHAGDEQGLQHLRRGAGGTHGGDNLGPAVTTHDLPAAKGRP